jgi:hypothetical protein
MALAVMTSYDQVLLCRGIEQLAAELIREMLRRNTESLQAAAGFRKHSALRQT